MIARAAAGLPTPALDRKPVFAERLDWYYSAFLALSRGRSVGMEPGGIAMADVLAWCIIHDVDDRPRFARIVGALDSSYLQMVRAKRK